MNISLPSTGYKSGASVSAVIPNVNCKTVQDLLVTFPKRNLRFVPSRIALVSKTVSSVSNGATVIVKEVNPTTPTAATLSTNLTGTNNDLVFTAVPSGAAGNSVTIAYIDPSGNDEELSIEVTGTDIVVNLATGGAGAITSTAAQILAAIEDNEDAAALVTVANKSSNNGTGVVTALAETALSGGLDWTVGDTLVASTDLADSDKEGLTQDLTLAATKEVIEGGRALLISITTGATATTDVKDVLLRFDVM